MNASIAGDHIQRLLQTIDAKSAAFESHFDPAWRKAVWQSVGFDVLKVSGDEAADENPSPETLFSGAATHRRVADVYSLRWPKLSVFRQRAHRLALLSRRQILQVFATLALYTERNRVRCSIQKSVRTLLIDHMVGPTAYQRLINSPITQGMNTSSEPLALSELNVIAWAQIGYRLLCQTGLWTNRECLAIVKMSFPPSTPAAQSQGLSSPANLVEITHALNHLPDFFPELTWLFGSDMENALSA
jgi:hypothetical protein